MTAKIIKAARDLILTVRSLADMLVKDLEVTDGDIETLRHVTDNLEAAIEDEAASQDKS